MRASIPPRRDGQKRSTARTRPLPGLHGRRSAATRLWLACYSPTGSPPTPSKSPTELSLQPLLTIWNRYAASVTAPVLRSRCRLPMSGADGTVQHQSARWSGGLNPGTFSPPTAVRANAYGTLGRLRKQAPTITRPTKLLHLKADDDPILPQLEAVTDDLILVVGSQHGPSAVSHFRLLSGALCDFGLILGGHARGAGTAGVRGRLLGRPDRWRRDLVRRASPSPGGDPIPALGRSLAESRAGLVLAVLCRP